MLCSVVTNQLQACSKPRPLSWEVHAAVPYFSSSAISRRSGPKCVWHPRGIIPRHQSRVGTHRGALLEPPILPRAACQLPHVGLQSTAVCTLLALAGGQGKHRPPALTISAVQVKTLLRMPPTAPPSYLTSPRCRRAPCSHPQCSSSSSSASFADSAVDPAPPAADQSVPTSTVIAALNPLQRKLR
jgi:hypothetical protein